MDTQDTLKSLLGDNAEDKIKAVLGSLSSSSTSEESSYKPPIDAATIGYVSKIKSALDELNTPPDDDRARLLLALHPYMRSERKRGIDSAVRMLNLTRLGSILGK